MHKYLQVQAHGNNLITYLETIDTGLIVLHQQLLMLYQLHPWKYISNRAALTYTTIGNATGKVQYSKVSGCNYDSLSNNHELV